MRRGYFRDIERGENRAIVRRSLCAAIDPRLQRGEVRGGELRLLARWHKGFFLLGNLLPQ